MNETKAFDPSTKALELLSAIVDSSDDAIISKNLDGTITSWNKSAERLFGYTEAEAIGQPVSMLIPKDRLDEEPKIIARIRQGDRVDHFETIRRRKDGKLIDISLTISPVRDPEGNVIGASKIARDTSALKQAEKTSRLLSAIVDSSDDAIISKNLDGTITSWNKSAERLFGYTEAEAIGQPVSMLIPKDRLEEEPKILSRLRNGERVDHFETVRRRKDGTLLNISLTISPIKNSNGIVVGASKIARDITERKRIDDEIRRANRDLEQFAFSASHDLQEPLRNVKIYSELLNQRFRHHFDGEALEYLGYLYEGATRMENLIRDLLAYTAVGEVSAAVEEIDANAVLTSALKTLDSVVAASAAEVTFDPLPHLSMRRVHLYQLFQNLIGNAIKYRAKDASPKIHIACVQKNDAYEFSVSDNGIGIAPPYRETIFGLFKRLHTTQEYPGTGIGLAICQRIVEQYNGRIWVESELNKGSIFRFTIRS